MSRPQPNIVMTPEMEQKFESELLWCIQQLQDSLKSGKLSKKQADNQVKSLNVLMGNSSIVKKRQTMRVLFGDYRAKMAEEEKKFSKINLKLAVEPIQPHKNSRCLKRRVPSDSTTDKCEEVTKNLSDIQIESSNPDNMRGSKSKFKFVPSDNSFRFNFGEN